MHSAVGLKSELACTCTALLLLLGWTCISLWSSSRTGPGPDLTDHINMDVTTNGSLFGSEVLGFWFAHEDLTERIVMISHTPIERGCNVESQFHSSYLSLSRWQILLGDSPSPKLSRRSDEIVFCHPVSLVDGKTWGKHANGNYRSRQNFWAHFILSCASLLDCSVITTCLIIPEENSGLNWTKPN